MIFQAVLRSEGSFAVYIGTGIRPFTSMRSLVSFQVMRSCESLATAGLSTSVFSMKLFGTFIIERKCYEFQKQL